VRGEIFWPKWDEVTDEGREVGMWKFKIWTPHSISFWWLNQEDEDRNKWHVWHGAKCIEYCGGKTW